MFGDDDKTDDKSDSGKEPEKAEPSKKQPTKKPSLKEKMAHAKKKVSAASEKNIPPQKRKKDHTL